MKVSKCLQPVILDSEHIRSSRGIKITCVFLENVCVWDVTGGATLNKISRRLQLKLASKNTFI